MAETIRESLYDANGVASFAQLKVLLSEGLLIPADEVQARIDSAVSEAVREERGRAAKIVQQARFGERDNDLRSVIYAIETGEEPDHD